MHKRPLRIPYRFSRPVSGMLVKAGQRVEHGTFPGIRIAGERNNFLLYRGFNPEFAL
jgi:hypothetical protein